MTTESDSKLEVGVTPDGRVVVKFENLVRSVVFHPGQALAFLNAFMQKTVQAAAAQAAIEVVKAQQAAMAPKEE